MTAAALALVAASVAPLPVQSIARDTAEPVILELALGRLASTTVGAYRLGDVALIPLTRFFDLAEIRIDRFDQDQLIATVYPGARRLSVQMAARTLTFDGATRVIGDQEFVTTVAEVYLPAGYIGAALDLDWNVSWGDLAATVVDPSTLPVAERLRRDWQRRTRALGQSSLVPERALRPPARTIDGMVLDYSLFAPSNRPLRSASYAASVGLELFGGALAGTVQSQDVPGRSGVRTDLSWAGVFAERKWLTQLRLGDGYTTGPRIRSVRGISLGNTPFVRPNLFGTAAFSGRLEPGWTVEAFRGGRLIAFDSVNALGQFSVDAPIQYGENPVEFIGYGPFGEIRRFDRTLRVDVGRLAARTFEYGVSLGACRGDRCDATMNVDARYGLSGRWTLRAGMDGFWRKGPGNLFHPYAGLTGNLTNALSIDGELVGDAVVRGGIRYEPSTDLVITAEALRFARGVRDPILTPDGRRSQLTGAVFFRPHRDRGATFFEASVDRIVLATATTLSGRVGGSFQRGELQLLPALRWQLDQQPGGASTRRMSFVLNTFLLPGPSFGSIFRGTTARSTFETEGSGRLRTFTAHLSRSFKQRWRVEVGGGWTRGQGATASLTIAANLSTLRSYTTVSHLAGQTQGTQFVQGSVLYDRAARAFSLGPGPSIDRSGVTGRVFLDVNGNDQYDPGEQPLQAVRVSVGMQTLMSGADGTFRLWNVTPHERSLVAIDSTTLASPLWVPAYRTVEIRPGPNRYEVVDIPIAPGGVIEGLVLRAADSLPIGGVALRLEHIASGATRTIVTFSDGEFYSIGIKPGEYILRLERRVEQRLGATAEPVRITVPAEPDGATIAGIVVVIR